MPLSSFWDRLAWLRQPNRRVAPLADFGTQDGESILESHRREIVVVFCDVRGFTVFAKRAEPEEAMACCATTTPRSGRLSRAPRGRSPTHSDDGVIVFFNDPLPTPEPTERAIAMAIAMRVLKTWRRHGHDLGISVGISQGFATLGQIGFAERMDYTAIGQ
jgi:adenylate cyclase